MKKFLFLTTFVLLLIPSLLEAAQVRGYFRRDGTYVRPYQRTNPDRNPYNNYGFPGHYNPNTGRATPGNPDTYLYRYYNRDRLPGFDNRSK
jgi:hypothetical protein